MSKGPEAAEGGLKVCKGLRGWSPDCGRRLEEVRLPLCWVGVEAVGRDGSSRSEE